MDGSGGDKKPSVVSQVSMICHTRQSECTMESEEGRSVEKQDDTRSDIAADSSATQKVKEPSNDKRSCFTTCYSVFTRKKARTVMANQSTANIASNFQVEQARAEKSSCMHYFFLSFCCHPIMLCLYQCACATRCVACLSKCTALLKQTGWAACARAVRCCRRVSQPLQVSSVVPVSSGDIEKGTLGCEKDVTDVSGAPIERWRFLVAPPELTGCPLDDHNVVL